LPCSSTKTVLKIQKKNILGKYKQKEKEIEYQGGYESSLSKKIKNYFKHRKSEEHVYFVIPRILTNQKDYDRFLKELYIYNDKCERMNEKIMSISDQNLDEKRDFPRTPVPITCECPKTTELYEKYKIYLPKAHSVVDTKKCRNVKGEFIYISENFYHPTEGYQYLINVIDDILEKNEFSKDDVAMTLFAEKYPYDYRCMKNIEQIIKEDVYFDDHRFKKLSIL